MIDDTQAWKVFCNIAGDTGNPTPRQIGDFARTVIEHYSPKPATETLVPVEILDAEGRVLARGESVFTATGVPETACKADRRGVATHVRALVFGQIPFVCELTSPYPTKPGDVLRVALPS